MILSLIIQFVWQNIIFRLVNKKNEMIKRLYDEYNKHFMLITLILTLVYPVSIYLFIVREFSESNTSEALMSDNFTMILFSMILIGLFVCSLIPMFKLEKLSQVMFKLEKVEKLKLMTRIYLINVLPIFVMWVIFILI